MSELSSTTVGARNVEFGDIIVVAGYQYQILEVSEAGSSMRFQMKPVHKGKALLDFDAMTIIVKNRHRFDIQRKI